METRLNLPTYLFTKIDASTHFHTFVYVSYPAKKSKCYGAIVYHPFIISFTRGVFLLFTCINSMHMVYLQCAFTSDTKYQTQIIYETPPKTLLRSDFCSEVSLEGYLTLSLILKFPFFPGSFDIGIPSSGTTTSAPGLTISVNGIMRLLPSNVVRSNVLPVRASRRVISWLITKSLPSLL